MIPHLRGVLEDSPIGGADESIGRGVRLGFTVGQSFQGIDMRLLMFPV
jgi:hypothetical protein